jgi:hypothetical protein
MSITFCNSTAQIIKSNFDYTIKKYHKIIQEIQLVDTLPIPENEEQLLSVDFSEKYYFLLTKKENFYYSVFIPQSTLGCAISCKFRFDEELYLDTLFTGEFFRNSKDTWSFYIEDIIAHKGTHTQKLLLADRIQLVYSILKNNYIWDEYMNVCHLELKPYFLAAQLLKDSDTTNTQCTIKSVPDSIFDPILLLTDTQNTPQPLPQESLPPPRTSLATNVSIKQVNTDVYTVHEKGTGKNMGFLNVQKAATSVQLQRFFSCKKHTEYYGKVISDSNGKWILLEQSPKTHKQV